MSEWDLRFLLVIHCYFQLHGVSEGIKYLHFMDPPIIHGDIRGVSNIIRKSCNKTHSVILLGECIGGRVSKPHSIGLRSRNYVGHEYCDIWDRLPHQRQYRVDGTGNSITFRAMIAFDLAYSGILCP